ncbi:MAG TPA: sigma 54-interacting transcriptional regulator, partial [Thermodesulfobacteriota bacterium]|nr:sigma 54-interacting transcriptional regulator [Thermodesulfobacteriota bacterium]
MLLVRCLTGDLEAGPLAPIARAARAAGFDVATSASLPALWSDLKGGGPRPAVVALEAAAAAEGRFALLRALKAWDPLVEVLLVAPTADPGLAVEAVRAGALDVLVPPAVEARARARLDQVRAERARRREMAELDARIGETFRFQGLVGRSPVMLDVFSLIARIAPHFSTALVTGEPGTGKELAARA